MTADDYLDLDIKEEYAKHGSRFRTARALGISLDRVDMVIGETAVQPDTKTTTYGGNGRPDIEKYMVARKRAGDEWDNTLPDIAEARKQYEAGTHEMCTGRDGDWLILYAIPRAVVTPRPNYFRQGSNF